MGIRSGAVLLTVSLVVASAAAQTGPGGTAIAAVKDAQGRIVGRADLRETPAGVLIALHLQNAPPGTHAFHIHAVGRCDAPDFASAGEHFAPAGRRHGFLAPGGGHAGDLPNLHVPATGALSVEMLADAFLAPGPGSLFDADGAALVLHADADDYLTDPSGGADRRIACGSIARRPVP